MTNLKYNEEELFENLIVWFKINDLEKPHLWYRNKVAKLIKEELNKVGKWRAFAKRKKLNKGRNNKKKLQNFQEKLNKNEPNKELDW